MVVPDRPASPQLNGSVPDVGANPVLYYRVKRTAAGVFVWSRRLHYGAAWPLARSLARDPEAALATVAQAIATNYLGRERATARVVRSLRDRFLTGLELEQPRQLDGVDLLQWAESLSAQGELL